MASDQYSVPLSVEWTAFGATTPITLNSNLFYAFLPRDGTLLNQTIRFGGIMVDQPWKMLPSGEYRVRPIQTGINRLLSTGLGPPFHTSFDAAEVPSAFDTEFTFTILPDCNQNLIDDRDESPVPSCTPPSGPPLNGVCVADVDDGSSTGVPDGGVTIDDLLYYLEIYGAGGASADVDDGSGEGQRDGGVTIDDLLFFLVHFQAGC